MLEKQEGEENILSQISTDSHRLPSPLSTLLFDSDTRAPRYRTKTALCTPFSLPQTHREIRAENGLKYRETHPHRGKCANGYWGT